jgi:hypothetical protein
MYTVKPHRKPQPDKLHHDETTQKSDCGCGQLSTVPVVESVTPQPKPPTRSVSNNSARIGVTILVIVAIGVVMWYITTKMGRGRRQLSSYQGY